MIEIFFSFGLWISKNYWVFFLFCSLILLWLYSLPLNFISHEPNEGLTKEKRSEKEVEETTS